MDQENNMEGLKETLGLPCKSCGNQLRYDADIQLLKCDYCGATEDIPRAKDKVVENDLKLVFSKAKFYSPEKNAQKVFDCQQCGAKFSVQSTAVNVDCAFCGSKNVNEEAFEHNYIQPTGIAPFTVSFDHAHEKFKHWIKKGWFHPSKLKQIAKADHIHGIYIPAWTYDANSFSKWSGQAGYYYYVTQSYTENGQVKTRQVRKVRWEPRSGSFQNSFDDVLVSASNGLKQSYLKGLEPFKLLDSINFNPELLVGWESEVYNVEVDKGYRIAEIEMDARNRSKASSALGGDTQRFLSVESKYSDQTFKLLLLPVWMASYTFKGKEYSFTVNGQTGKVYGKKPISAIKIILLIIVISAIAFTIYYLQENNIIQL
jgi:DNA-directed RNA polymerase subunit RPC12/RpoP